MKKIKILLALSCLIGASIFFPKQEAKAVAPVCTGHPMGKLSSNYKISKTITGGDGFKYTFVNYQTTSINQDAVIFKTDASNRLCWEKKYTTSPADERAVDGAMVNEGTRTTPQYYMYGLFYADGGNTSLKASSDGFMPSYGANASGAKVASFIGKIDASSGDIIRGTFLSARMGTSGKCSPNTIKPISIKVDSTGVIVTGASYYGAPVANATPSTLKQITKYYSQSGGYTYIATFSKDLKFLLNTAGATDFVARTCSN